MEPAAGTASTDPLLVGSERVRRGAERAPSRVLATLALLGTTLTVLGGILEVHRDGFGWLGLVQPGSDGPSAAVFVEDFPDVDLIEGSGHDGQQFYAIARDFPDLGAASAHLDRPQYRLQRPLFPMLSWLLHPSGGGWGLVAATAVVGALSLLGLGLAAGALSVRLGGPAWVALFAPLLPGSFYAFRMGVADNLALALAIAYLLAAERRRIGLAVAAAVAAVLAKEAILVLIVGYAVVRRTKPAVIAGVAATATVASWWLALRALVEASSPQVVEFTYPLGGVIDNVGFWRTHGHLLAASTVVGTLVAAAVVVVRRPHHPLFGAVLAFAAFSLLFGRDVLGLDQNGTRTIGPLVLLVVLVALTPGARAGAPWPGRRPCGPPPG